MLRLSTMTCGLVLASVVTAPPAAAAIKVACVGDSITAGAGSTGGNNYPAVLGRMLGAAYQVGNFGDSGSTMLKIPAGSSYWNQPAFGASKTFAPDVVVIMLGTNDSKTSTWNGGKNTFEADYRAMIDVFTALPSKPRVYAVLPPPALSRNFDINGAVITNEILPLIRKLAAAASVPVIDVFGAFRPDPRIYFGPGNGNDIGDGIHPNNAGAAAIARAVAQKITAPSVSVDGGADGRPAGDGPSMEDVGHDAQASMDVTAEGPGAGGDARGGSGTSTEVGGTGGAGATGGRGGYGGSTSPRPDAGMPTSAPPPPDAGCGCALGAQPRAGLLTPLGLVVFVGLRRICRRRGQVLRGRRASRPSAGCDPRLSAGVSSSNGPAELPAGPSIVGG